MVSDLCDFVDKITIHKTPNIIIANIRIYVNSFKDHHIRIMIFG